MDKHPCIIEVRGEGLLIGAELGRDRATREPFPPEAKFGHRVIRAAREYGLLLRDAPDFAVFSPPLTISEAEVDELLDIFDRALTQVLSEMGEKALTASA
jgi:4-aminobutyrate aminotransferase-like enzyme